MYFHVLLETAEKNPKTNSYKQHFELDKPEIDIVEREVIEPFLRGQKFQFDGYFMSSGDIKRIVVKSTERSTSQLSDHENSIIRPRGLISSTSRQDIFWLDKYAKDITKEVFASVQARGLTQETSSTDPKTDVIRPTTVERKITEVINKLKEFVLHLRRLVSNAGPNEDWQIGDVRLRRWKKRVVTYLKEEVSEEEVNNFDQIELRGTTQSGAGSYLYEAFQPLEGALDALADRIEEDPLAVLRIGLIEAAFVADQEEVLIIFDVFLSYASTDQIEADQIYEAIERAGGKVFLAGKNLRPGDDFAEEIRNALWSSREVWLLVSPNSLKSDWVISEWGAAWALRKRIVPILFDALPRKYLIESEGYIA